jgi:prepilin-type N-terminal cleavage/methylation domain-containing protein
MSRRAQAGLTLIELMVTIVVAGIAVGVVLAIQSSLAVAYRAQSRLAEAQQNLRAALDLIVRDVRQAGYGCGTLQQDVGAGPVRVHAITVDNDEDGNEGADSITIHYGDASAPIVVDAGPGNPFGANSTLVDTIAGLNVGDVVFASYRGTACLFKITDLSAGADPAIEHVAGGSGAPYNQPGNANCSDIAVSDWDSGQTMIYRRISRTYRLRPGDRRGVLEMSPSGGAADDWEELAHGMVDLQVTIRVHDPSATAAALDEDGDGDPQREWYSGDNMETALDGPLPPDADAKELVAVRITLVSKPFAELGGPGQDQSPQLCDPARPESNRIGDHCQTALADYTEPSSRYHGVTHLRTQSANVDVRNVGMGAGL